MQTVEIHTADMAFQQKLVRDVRIVMRSPKEWYFTFEVEDPVSRGPARYATRTQRGQLRLWSDPRTLFTHLRERYGVESGTFTLIEENTNEQPGST